MNDTMFSVPTLMAGEMSQSSFLLPDDVRVKPTYWLPL